AKRSLEQVRGSVVGHRRETHAPGNDRTHAVAGGEAVAAEDERLVCVEAVCVDELRAYRRLAVPLDPAFVCHLAAAGRVERRLAELREERAVAELLERPDLREDVDLRVADELGLEPCVAGELAGALEQPALARAARDLPVLVHLGAVAVDVDRLSALLGELRRELDREAVRRRERERLLAGDRLCAREVVEEPRTALERLGESL